MLAHSFLIESSSKLLVTRKGIKARTSSISGLWFPWPIYMFFEMRFDLGTLDSGERSLFFGLLVIIIITTLQGKWAFGWLIFEPTHDKSDLIVVRWVILQTRMRSQQWGARCMPFSMKLPLVPFIVWANSEGSGDTAQARLSLHRSPMW